MGAIAGWPGAAHLVGCLMQRWLLGLALLMGLALPAMAACPAAVRGQALPAEGTASAIGWQPWQFAVDAMTERLRRSDVSRTRLVFIGDSITEGWQAQVFQQFYGHRLALNLGIGGDATQGLLWRLDRGHWPSNLRPQAIVLLIGTNNIGAGASAENTAQGIFQVVARLQQISPQSRILLLGVLPRGATAQDPTRAAVAQVNRLIAACADNQRVFFADPGSVMIDALGNLPEWVAYDRLHLTMVGYSLMAAAIEPRLREMISRW